MNDLLDNLKNLKIGRRNVALVVIAVVIMLLLLLSELFTNDNTDAVSKEDSEAYASQYIEKTEKDCLFAILDGHIDDDTDIVTIFYGADVSEDDVEELEEQLEQKFPDTDFSFNYGGQPVYSYILSVE